MFWLGGLYFSPRKAKIINCTPDNQWQCSLLLSGWSLVSWITLHLKEAIQTLSIAVLPDFKHSSLSKLELKSYVWFTATTTPIKQGKSTGERRMISHSGCLEAWWRGCACHSLPRLSRHNTTWHGHPNKSTRQLFTLEKNVKYYMSAYYMLSSYCATA